MGFISFELFMLNLAKYVSFSQIFQYYQYIKKSCILFCIDKNMD